MRPRSNVTSRVWPVVVAALGLGAGLAAQQRELLDLTQRPERAVRAGQPFRAVLFGTPMERPFRDRRHVDAWDLGFVNSPGLDGGETLLLVSDNNFGVTQRTAFFAFAIE